LFNSKTRLNYPIGKRLSFKRDEILQKIGFIEEIVTKVDSMLNEKLKIGEEA
jgi:hypothetical protein